MDEQTLPVLGDRVTITGYLEKRKPYRNGRCCTVWDRVPLSEPRVGVVCGRRNLPTGYTIFDREDGYEFRHQGTVRAILVAVSQTTIRRVAVEDVQTEGSDG